MTFPKPTEVAVLTVNGKKFTDWETVMVRQAMKDHPAFHCRFTCSEALPISANLAVMQIKPGDVCAVTLGGFPAFKGNVETRQVYYDSRRHHVELQCATGLAVATTAVVSPTHQFKGTFQQIGQQVLNQLGIKMVFIGGAPPSYKFDRVSATPGESIHDFLDMLARGLSQATGIGISFTSNVDGDFVVAMGPKGGSDSVVEGQNILVGREIIYDPSAQGTNQIVGQAPGTDKLNMDKISHSPFYAQAVQMLGTLSSSAGVIVNELPIVDKEYLKGRSSSEGMWQQGEQITVFTTVQGWIRPTGGLWEPDQNVSVTSPMLMMQNQTLVAKSITFTQDNQSGTRTVLELCNAAAYSPSPEIKQPG